jgi:hypothetical protein
MRFSPSRLDFLAVRTVAATPASVSLAVDMALNVPRTARRLRACVVYCGQYRLLEQGLWIALRSCRLLSVNTAIEPSPRILNPAVPLIQSFHNISLLQNGVELAGAPFLEFGVQLPPDAFQCGRAMLSWRRKTRAEVGV